MVFVRVHLMKGRLSTAQKEELGAKLVQAVSEVENLVNNHTHKETSWVQFYEFEPENWYAPANVTGADPNSRIQLDVIGDGLNEFRAELLLLRGVQAFLH